jgi:DNA-binding response OmpR family regulator
VTHKRSVLVIDDDPSHLHIYCLLVERAGFRALPALVNYSGVKLPENELLDAVLLDYCLTGNISACDIARQVRRKYDSVPILVLSDLLEVPVDIAPLVQGFVRKGDPEKLLSTLRNLAQPAVKKSAESGQLSEAT